MENLRRSYNELRTRLGRSLSDGEDAPLIEDEEDTERGKVYRYDHADDTDRVDDTPNREIKRSPARHVKQRRRKFSASSAAMSFPTISSSGRSSPSISRDRRSTSDRSIYSRTPQYSTPSVSHPTRGDYSVQFGSANMSPELPKRQRAQRVQELKNIIRAIEAEEDEKEPEIHTRVEGKGKQKVPRLPTRFNLLVAKTALVLDYSYDNPAIGAQKWSTSLLERFIIDKHTGKHIPLWKVHEKPPHEVAELTPRFRMRCGYLDPHRDQPNARCINKNHLEIWKCRLLKLTKEAKQVLFPLNRARIWALQNGERVERDLDKDPKGETTRYKSIACELEVLSVMIILCPLSGALLVIKFNWKPMPIDHEHRPSKDFESYSVDTLDDLRTWLFLAQFREEVENVTEGWTFPPFAQDHLGPTGKEDTELHVKNTKETPYLVEHLGSLGRLASAIYEEKPLPLGSIGNWLVHLPEESDFFPPLRINRGQRCHHHTVVVIDRKPKDDVLDEYIHDLRRAQGQINKPNFKKAQQKGSKARDKVLIERENRYIGLAVEGIVCITWPTKDVSTHYCLNIWPRQFLAIYMVLAEQVHAESVVLHELFNMSSELADDLDIDNKLTLPEMEVYRSNLRSLATRMIQYTVSMSSDDCGGRSEYSQFFSNLRKVFRIHKDKKELREIIDDVLGIVDAGYAEEQKKTKANDLRMERQRQKERKAEIAKKERKRRIFELLMSAAAAISLPLVTVTGIFGMNFSDLPDPGFWPVFWSAVAVSFVLLLVLFTTYCCCFSSHQIIKKWPTPGMLGLSKSQPETTTDLGLGGHSDLLLKTPGTPGRL